MISPTFFLKNEEALADGVTDATAALQEAIDTCHASGGGQVRVRPGRYLIRPIRLKSRVELHLERGAVLLGSPRPEDYPNWESRKINTQWAPYNARYLIIAEDAEEIAITGAGEIDGQAEAHYESTLLQGRRFWPVKDKATRPGRMIFFALCRRVRVEGVTLRNAPAWTVWMLGCEAVRFHGVTIRTPYEAINTDGIDIDSCRDVTISHCDIRSGDDCIILRAIDRMLKEPRPCEQVRVENCTLASNCNAIRLSYLRDGLIRNAVFENVTILDSRRGVICQVPLARETPEKNENPLYPLGEGPGIENIRFSNLRVEAVQPLWLRLSDGEPVRHLRNLVFENGWFSGEMPSVIKGNEYARVENVIFRNFHWSHRPREGAGPAVLEVDRGEGIVFENVAFESCGEGEPVDMTASKRISFFHGK